MSWNRAVLNHYHSSDRMGAYFHQVERVAVYVLTFQQCLFKEDRVSTFGVSKSNFEWRNTKEITGHEKYTDRKEIIFEKLFCTIISFSRFLHAAGWFYLL